MKYATIYHLFRLLYLKHLPLIHTLDYNINEFEQVLITIRGENTGRRQGRS